MRKLELLRERRRDERAGDDRHPVCRWRKRPDENYPGPPQSGSPALLRLFRTPWRGAGAW
jgi:hypothetical protein